MSILYIFSDESGTMPINDSDDPFVVATIGFLDHLPSYESGSNDNSKLVSFLRREKALPVITFVKPYPGYSQLLQARYEKIETMARYKCLSEGKNIRYPDKGHINIRNEVWQQAMLQAIIHNLLIIIFDYSSYTELTLIFDEKTMTHDRHILFEKLFVNIDTLLRQYLKTFIGSYPKDLVSLIIDKIQFS